MFKKILLPVFLFCSLGLLGLWISNTKPKSFFASKTPDYVQLWKRVDSCEKKGLTESALKVVELIYNKAKSENNAAQTVKAVIHRMKFTQYKQEFAQEKNISELQKEVESSVHPVKAVLQSLLAEAYWMYYQNNRWKFQNRSATLNFKKEDISTYSLNDLVNACVKQYKASLTNSAALQATRLEIFEEVILPGSTVTRSWRPSLYDFLAHRSLDFFKNSEADVSKAANQFSYNQANYLKPYPQFLAVKIIPVQDSLDFRYCALKLFQELGNYKLKTSNREGLADLELERLQYLYNNSVHPSKDSIFISSLDWLVKDFEKSPRAAEFLYLKADHEARKASAYHPLRDSSSKWSRKKVFGICKQILQTYPKTRGATLAYNLSKEIQSKSISITAEKVNDPLTNNRILVKYRNVSKLYFKLLKADYFDYLLLSYKYYNKDIYRRFLDLPLLQKFEENLPDDGDFNPHSTEIKLSAPEEGYYILLSSLNPDFSFKDNLLSHQLICVSQLSYLNHRKNGSYNKLFTLHRQTGQPLAGVQTQVWHLDYNNKTRDWEYSKGKSYESDAEGKVEMELLEQNYRNTFIEMIKGKDHLFSQDHSLFSSYRESIPENRTSSFIFTDRAIYRPGQIIYFKSLVLNGSRNKFQVLPNHPLTLSFYDVNHQKISSLELITNEYGTVSGSFTAPQGLLNGQMMISDGISSKYLSVEDYKRPKFETVFDSLRGDYSLFDSVKVKGFAKAYSGNVIDGAEVSYRVVRTSHYPVWYYWYRPYVRPAPSTEICNGTTTTDSKGEYNISFVALPDPNENKKEQAVYIFEIFADVTDINGETRSSSSFFKAGYQSLELEFNCPEILNVKDLPPIQINARNLNGIEEKINGTMSVYKLETPSRLFRTRLWEQPDRHIFSKTEYYKLFPYDQFEDELNPYSWKRSQKLWTKNFITKTENASLWRDFKNLSPGAYLAEAVVKDKKGNEVKCLNYITVYQPDGTELPYPMTQWNFVLKNQAEPGEKASFVMASSYTDVNCYYEVSDQENSITRLLQTTLKPVEIEITEAQRGGLFISTQFIKFGRTYSGNHAIAVPFSNKEIDISYSTFRNKLLPGQAEEWTLSLKNKKGEKLAAEMLAAMYDASLDAFVPNRWSFSLYQPYYQRSHWIHDVQELSYSIGWNDLHYEQLRPESYTYDQLNYFGLGFYGGSYSEEVQISSRNVKYKHGTRRAQGEAVQEQPGNLAPMAASFADADSKSGTVVNGELFDRTAETSVPKPNPAQSPPPLRKNFNETAFFYPDLRTNEKGDVLIKFTVPESLTRWKLLGFAHTKDLSLGFTENECVTQKDLMVVPNLPRFFREGDEMIIRVKVNNLSQEELFTQAELHFYDALNDQELTGEWMASQELLKENWVKTGESKAISWKIKVPENTQAIKVRSMARAGNFSDAEESVIPVLSNRMLVTESINLPIRGKQSKDFSFVKFISQNNHSETLKNKAFTLEFTANPAWYAVQSLPYLMEYPYECAEQTFSRYYANALARHMVNSKPQIKKIFDAWTLNNPSAFLSNLEKNQELKALILQETPWVLEAKEESENKKRIALLFDLNRMAHELTATLNKLEQMQNSSGAWPWFKGSPDDWYITQHILTGLGKLNKLGAIQLKEETKISAMSERAIAFCDEKIKEHFEQIKKYSPAYKIENHLDHMAVHYLYMRSFYTNNPLPVKSKEAFAYFKNQAESYWLKSGRFAQGMVAVSLFRYGDQKTPASIVRSLRENALNSDEMGMYWKENYGYYWYQAPVEMQALMIEAFDEITSDTKVVDDLKTWLLKSKQTQNWGSTKATADAIYALLLRGTDWLLTEPGIRIQTGTIQLDPQNDKSLGAEAGTGYFKKTFSGSEIKPELGQIRISKTTEGVSWGAAYWQYFEQLDKITPHETPLKLNRKLFLQKNSPVGPIITAVDENTLLKPGDKLTVRIELRVDRDMEYVHLKDMRASGLEPLNVLSTYKYQDGLGYYESTGDAATNFFITWLPKGTYVFEYPVVISHSGNFSNGISSIQCMYAPEYTSHSEGLRIHIKN